MGHIRLGDLPKTKRWRQVISLLEGGSNPDAIASATLAAAEEGFRQAAKDTGFRYTIWLLTQVTLAARKDNFSQELNKLGLNVKQLENSEIHIHVPAGSIPKDGPSAGITIVIALISLFKNSKIKNNIAMTGEITLRGKVLPIGGVKEKLLAASRAGIKQDILPAKNENDLIELPEEIKKTLQIHLVDKIEEAADIIYGK